jgi:hypothetical protein
VPAKPSWFLQLPRILEELESIPAAVIDRESVESLFRVKRRRAQQLMAAFGGFLAGRTFLVERRQLMDALDAWRGGEAFDREERRKARLAEQVEEARRSIAARKVRIPLAPKPRNELPEGVELGNGQLRITFSSAEELLTRLFALSQAIAEDFPRFEAAVQSKELWQRSTS